MSPLGAGAAYADGATGLGIETYAEMMVDSAHGHLFFSLGRQRSGVRVTDLSGGAQRTIPDLPGASGMALSVDASKLYVALADAGAVAAIDTTTLAETQRWSIGAGSCPTWLTPAGGKLYLGYGCQYGKGKLGSLDLRGATPGPWSGGTSSHRAAISTGKGSPSAPTAARSTSSAPTRTGRTPPCVD